MSEPDRDQLAHSSVPAEEMCSAPNAATRAVLAEYAEMLADPQKYRRYDSFAELLKEIPDENDKAVPSGQF